jgi:acetoin utilization deacetylase AcuC-like enzyme
MREQRALGLPWSEALVERARRSVGGTVAAALHAVEHGLGMNLGGGTHHAGFDFARGYCLFNDVAVALARLRVDGQAARALVVDCDVHQGDGTAQLLGPDPGTFTLSLHGARNYPFQRVPSDLDVDLASGTGDARYLRALEQALDFALPRAEPDVAFYLAGADPWEGDRLGRLALTKAGLRARDELVLDRLRAAGAAVCVVLAGGYAEDVRDTVDINAATVEAVAARLGTPAGLH